MAEREFLIGMDEEEYEETRKSWKEYDESERQERWKQMSVDQQLTLASQYQDEIVTYAENPHEDHLINVDRVIQSVLLKGVGKELYTLGLDTDEFDETYQHWDELDEEERQKYWKKMTDSQKTMILNEYHTKKSSLENGQTALYIWRDYDTEEISRFTVSAEEWNNLPKEEREQRWYHLPTGERQTLEERDEYQTDDIDIAPEKLEGRNWYTLTEREQVTIAEDNEYRVEDFGYKPKTDKDITELSTTTGLVGAGVGSGMSWYFTEPLRQSGDPQTQLTGWLTPSIITAGSFAAGAIGGGVVKDALTPAEKKYDFIRKTVQNAFEEQQGQEQEQEATTDTT